ncbi:MAG: thioredoxin domain-containing protein [Bdellovibrionaceae bacterium]|mgnify:CR=1 FL=1|jgi:protein-disulfide isomerase/uncharacterized membrane protein|nr:thioredoxin domain-containing protein [Pseudobdellovibrionaceae bacterium]
MKKSTLAILIILAAIITHAYLSVHYYPVKFGTATGDSVCNINSTFNCDSVAASEYSSFLNIPLAVWGVVTNILLFILLAIPLMGFTEKPKQYFSAAFYFSTVVLSASFVMGGVSLVKLNTYCLFCIIAYILSIFSFELIRRINNEENPEKDFKLEFTNLKLLIIALFMIPVLSFIVHKAVMASYDADIKKSGQGSLESFIHRSVKGWESTPKFDFPDSDALTMGPADAKIVIVEFADFLCPHCKKAAPSLHSFTKSHPDVQLKFYAFPLDGSCNKAIKRTGGGERCKLAKATYCANQKGFGWPMHDYLLNNQEKMQSHDAIDSGIKHVLEKDFPMLSFESFKVCLDSEETHEAILKHAARGETAKIEGTPTVFLQGKKLNGGQILPILEGAYKTLK